MEKPTPPGSSLIMKKKGSRRRNRASPATAAYGSCRVCRNRRVLCDGTRPTCKNCASRGYECPGYSVWEVDLSSIDADQQSFLSGRAGQTTGSPSRALSSPLSNQHTVTDEARHAFDYFRYRICANFLDRHYPISWATSSISLAPQEPAVFYALAALSITEQALAHTIHNTLARPVDVSRRNLAIRMYSKAISCLQQPMHKVISGDGSLETVILSCVIFLVYEVYTGNTLNAMRHARIGKAILDERLASAGHRPGASTSTAGATSRAYEQISTISMMQAFDFALPLPLEQCLQKNEDSVFASLREARSYLETLIEAAQEVKEVLLERAGDVVRNLAHIESEISRYCLEHTFSRFVPIDASLQERLNQLISGFASWGMKFNAMYSSGHYISQDLFYLQIRFFNASFTLAMCRADTEKLTDYFADQFIRTVDCAERLYRRRQKLSDDDNQDTTTGPIATEFMNKLKITDPSRRSVVDHDEEVLYRVDDSSHGLDGSPAAGVFEFGILPALFAVACKCRTTGLRRRAAQLLATIHRWEAVTSSDTLAIYAERIIDLEEQQTALIPGLTGHDVEFYADEVPEEARFLDIVAGPIVETSGTFTLGCTRRAAVGDDVQLFEYECGPIKGQQRLIREESIGMSGFRSAASSR